MESQRKADMGDVDILAGQPEKFCEGEFIA